jgi:hypothetical protein
MRAGSADAAGGSTLQALDVAMAAGAEAGPAGQHLVDSETSEVSKRVLPGTVDASGGVCCFCTVPRIPARWRAGREAVGRLVRDRSGQGQGRAAQTVRSRAVIGS